MGEYSSWKENIEIQEESGGVSLFSIERTDVMTGDHNRGRYLLYQLKMSIRQAERIDIVVSFLMESGVRLILKDLRQALDRGVKIRLLTGNYLGITQPSALYLIKSELGGRVDLRFYGDKRRSFHPKAYLFHRKTESEIYIGSSNLSGSALTSGIEWNYRFSSRVDPKNFGMFYAAFEELFYQHSIVVDDEELRRYSKGWRRPAVAKDLERYERRELKERFDAHTPTVSEGGAENAESSAQLQVKTGQKKVPGNIYEPRGIQIEALYALRASRAEGAEKGLVWAATGVGKTYLAAFDSKDYEHVLFVAHREEILRQAAEAFRNVRRSEDYGFFDGKTKDTGKAVIFASVASLGREVFLNEAYFAWDYFDYIVVDEFHHAVNEQYRRILKYFKPKYLLGLTATPDRLDGRNIYELCDYIVPYEISLHEAIGRGILVPFHYYGIYDETDYSKLHVVRGRYDEKELNETYIGNVVRYDLIYRHYRKYRSKRALGFCCSRVHAETMAEEFSARGVPSVAVYSNADGEFSEERQIAIRRLVTGEIRVIFSVDMFNEGVDIPVLDMVMFLRPTESQVVFLQQLGRGLRKSRHKEYLNVLDFIGNYEKAGAAPYLLSGKRYERESAAAGTWQEFEFPEDCIVDFDLRLIDLFQEMAKRGMRIRDRIRAEYFRVKELLDGKRPGRMELFTYMEDEVYLSCMNAPKENPFRNYLEYLHGLGELTVEEERLCAGIGKEFLHILETTSMQKSYKMPVLLTFYNAGDVRMAVTEEELLASWKEFYRRGTNWKDLKDGITYEEYRAITDRRHLSNVIKNPVNFLRKSGEGFFVERDGYVLALREELLDVVKDEAFRVHMQDIIAYRTMEYYRRRYAGDETPV